MPTDLTPEQRARVEEAARALMQATGAAEDACHVGTSQRFERAMQVRDESRAALLATVEAVVGESVARERQPVMPDPDHFQCDQCGRVSGMIESHDTPTGLRLYLCGWCHPLSVPPGRSERPRREPHPVRPHTPGDATAMRPEGWGAHLKPPYKD